MSAPRLGEEKYRFIKARQQEYANQYMLSSLVYYIENDNHNQ